MNEPVTSASITFACPGCQKQFRVDSSRTGKPGKCSSCGATFQIPKASTPPTPVIPPVQPAGPPSLVEEELSEAPRQRRTFGFECSTCQTRLQAHVRDVGKPIKCPDCYVVMAIPEPPLVKGPNIPGAMEGEQYELWQSDSQPSPKLLRKAQRNSIHFPCSLCETILSATVDQVGERIVCPDCHCKNVVPLPSREMIAKFELDEDAYELDEASAPGALPEMLRTLAHERVYEGEEEDRTLDRADVDGPTLRPMPKYPLVAGLFSHLKGLAAFSHWAILSTSLAIIIFIWLYAINNLLNGYMAFVGVCALALGIMLTAMWVSLASACWIAILKESSDGANRIGDWPDMQFLDWMFECMYLAIPISMAGVPLWWVVKYSGLEPQYAWAVGLGIAYLLFPLFVLSTLESNSPFGIFSPGVFLSMRNAVVAWFFFYVLSGFFVTLLYFGILFALRQGSGLKLLIPPYCVFFSFVYFRLLGRLGWCAARSIRVE